MGPFFGAHTPVPLLPYFVAHPHDDEIPEVEALGRQIVQQMPEEQLKEGYATGSGLTVPLTDPAER